MKLIVDLKDRQYPIWIERKALYHIDEIINTHRKIAIIHDDAIPSKWIEITPCRCAPGPHDKFAPEQTILFRGVGNSFI